MSDNKNISVIDIKDISGFSHSDPDGVAVIMPCTDTEAGMKTADILHRRAGMGCTILVIHDTLRQGFVKTLNQTAARISAKYIVYLAQDAWPGRGWLKCGYDTLEKSGKGLLAFNDGKWHGHIASFGMVRTSWIKTLYGEDIFYPGYASHGADNEITVIARVQNNHEYNPDCTLMEYDPHKDFGGSNNPKDSKLFKQRFTQGFDGLAPLSKLQELALEYKVKWIHSGVSIIINANKTPDRLEGFLATFTRTNTFHPVELIILDHGSSKETANTITNYSTSNIIRHIIIPEDQQMTANNVYIWKTAADKARYLYLLFLKDIVEYNNDLLQCILKDFENPEIEIILINKENILNQKNDYHYTIINKEQLIDNMNCHGFICRKTDITTSTIKKLLE